MDPPIILRTFIKGHMGAIEDTAALILEQHPWRETSSIPWAEGEHSAFVLPQSSTHPCTVGVCFSSEFEPQSTDTILPVLLRLKLK